MSTRQHLPPRCPIQKKPNAGLIDEPFSPRHQRSSSQSLVKEQPAWLENLLDDPESVNEGIVLRRAMSDPVTLLGGIADTLSSPSCQNAELSVDNEPCSKWDSASLYGPNSPRRKTSLPFSGNALVSALSEYVSDEPIQNMDGALCISGLAHSNSKGDSWNSVGELNAKMNVAKRHPGQRSRIRKLQYIAELERTVDGLQTLESELAVKVASLLQQRVALSMANSRLKQQVARIQHEKLIIDGEYQSLKKEIRRLRIDLSNKQDNNNKAYLGSSSCEAARVEAMQNLDLGKLTLF